MISLGHPQDRTPPLPGHAHTQRAPRAGRSWGRPWRRPSCETARGRQSETRASDTARGRGQGAAACAEQRENRFRRRRHTPSRRPAGQPYPPLSDEPRTTYPGGGQLLDGVPVRSAVLRRKRHRPRGQLGLKERRAQVHALGV
eukprot:366056-Chlamydomonas_euryale.AAC.3